MPVGADGNLDSLGFASSHKLVIGAIFTVLGVGIYSTSLVRDFTVGLSHPYRHLYHDVPLKEVSNYASVVQPLVTHNQTFDIAVTVWLRTNELREHAEPVGEQDLDESQTMEVLETPLFSDIAFRGLTLGQKDVFSVVNFSVPMAIL